MLVITVDTETSGFAPRGSDYKVDYANYPYIGSIAWQVHDDDRLVYEQYNYIYPDGWEMPEGASKVNGLTTELLKEKGLDMLSVLRHFVIDAQQCERIVGHNLIGYDMPIIKANLLRLGVPLDKITDQLHLDKRFDTMLQAMNPMGVSKWPRLEEVYKYFFGETFDGAHDAMNDVRATFKVYQQLTKQ